MRQAFFVVFLFALLFGGCDKCEIQEPVTVFADFGIFKSTLDTIPEFDFLDQYDTTLMRDAALRSFDFLRNEVMVNPTLDSNADYRMVIDSVTVSETYGSQLYYENCYEEGTWLFPSQDPQDTFRFYLNGLKVRMVCTFYSNSRTPITWHYTGSFGAGDVATTEPPPGMDTTGNPCIEWWVKTLDTGSNSNMTFVKEMIEAAAHDIFRQFKCDVAKSQRGK